MFKGCTSLLNAPDLPATSISNSSYSNMFEGCTSLISAPSLPATEVDLKSYYCMFKGCESLVSPPSISATSFLGNPYSDAGGMQSMFEDCISLASAPLLMPTNVKAYSYMSMFKGCTSLISAPSLPATTVGTFCYKEMFMNCTSLTTVPAMPGDIGTLGGNYDSMFEGCNSLKVYSSSGEGHDKPWRIPATGSKPEGYTIYESRFFYGTVGDYTSSNVEVYATFYTQNTQV